MTFSAQPGDYKQEAVLDTVWQGKGCAVIATFLPRNEKVVIKKYDLEKCADDFDLLQHEMRTLRAVRHPNLCSLTGSVVVRQEAWLVLPYHVCSMAALLHTRFCLGLPELVIAIAARDVLLALQYLHSRHTIHRAVQARHVLVSRSGHAVLSGLRHSISTFGPDGQEKRALHTYPRHPGPLLKWASPEMLHQDLRGYSYPSDVYSLGLTVCELANAEEPYEDLEPGYMMVEKLRARVPVLLDASTVRRDDVYGEAEVRGSCDTLTGGLKLSCGPTGPQDYDAKLASRLERQFSATAHMFVRRCLALQGASRPSVSDLLSGDPFIRQARKATTSSILALLQIHPSDIISNEDDATFDVCKELSEASLQDSAWSFDSVSV